MNLKANNIGPAGGQAIGKALVYNSALEHLDLSNNDMGEDGGMELAAALQVNTSLTTLLISGCNLSANALIALATVLQSNNSVEKLDISNNVKSYGLSETLQDNVLAHWGRTIESNYGLKTLNLSKMQITDWFMCEIMSNSFFLNQNIVSLDLSCNKITIDGGKALCKALESHISLNHLKLSCCAFQDEGAFAIAQLLQVNRKIRALYLDYNKITGKGLIAIAKGINANTSLHYIALWGNQWSVEACQAYLDFVGGIVSAVTIGEECDRMRKPHGRLQSDFVFAKIEGVLTAAHSQLIVEL